MQNLKKIMFIGLALVIFYGCVISTANAEMVNKIIVFNDKIVTADRNKFVMDWKSYGVTRVMDLPFMNSMVVSVPDEISSEDLAADPRVADVENDQNTAMQGIFATGDGGAGDGGAGDGGAGDYLFNDFIELVPEPDIYERPWGLLEAYGLDYDPQLHLYDFTDSLSYILETVLNQLQSNICIKVAIFDTGVDLNHSRLSTCVKGGIDLVNMVDDIPMDDNGHGTHIAGIISGDKLGLAPGAEIYAVKVLDEAATGNISTLIMAFQWAIENRMNIINMSLAFHEDNPIVHLAIKKASQAGLIMVAAAGNHSNWEEDEDIDGDGSAGDGGAGDGGAGDGGASGEEIWEGTFPVMYPAAYPEVIAVGAHDSFGYIAEFSNTGPEVDLLAPGIDIVSSVIGELYGSCNGTSMAAAHVTATVAMMLTAKPDLSPKTVEKILKATAKDGNLNLKGAVEKVYFTKKSIRWRPISVEPIIVEPISVEPIIVETSPEIYNRVNMQLVF